MNYFKDEIKNILPYDGETIYYGQMLETKQADQYFTVLFETIDWQHDKLKIFGKTLITKRKVAWYGEKEAVYTYSNTSKTAKKFTKELTELKAFIENITGQAFNSCLLNLYHHGGEGMSWHADNEKELGSEPVIASLSLGAERKFSLKHNTTKLKIDLNLEHGSLLLMKGQTQACWKHALPKTKKVLAARINLTFRML